MTKINKIIPISEFLKFAKWTATPKRIRQPENQKEFAAKIRVNENTLCAWEKHPQFWPLVQSLHSWVKKRLPNIISALYDCSSEEKARQKKWKSFSGLEGSTSAKKKINKG